MDSLEAAPAAEVASGADRKISLLSLSLSQPPTNIHSCLLPFGSVIMWMDLGLVIMRYARLNDSVMMHRCLYR